MMAKSGVGGEGVFAVQDVGYSASRAAARWPPDERPQIPKPDIARPLSAIMDSAFCASSRGAWGPVVAVGKRCTRTKAWKPRLVSQRATATPSRPTMS